MWPFSRRRAATLRAARSIGDLLLSFIAAILDGDRAVAHPVLPFCSCLQIFHFFTNFPSKNPENTVREPLSFLGTNERITYVFRIFEPGLKVSLALGYPA